MGSTALRLRLQDKRARLDALVAELSALPESTDYTGWEWPYRYRKVAEQLRADESLVRLPVTELAARFSVSPQTVYRALAEVGISPESVPGRRRRRWRNRDNVTESVVRHLEEHGTDGRSDRALARELGASRNTIRRARRELGLPGRSPGRPRRPAGRDTEIVKLRDSDGLTFAAIGKRLGMTRQAAHKRYRLAVERGLRAARI